MAGISTKAAGSLKNRFKYNEKEEQREEFADGTGLDWYDYGSRMYDPQIGRWHTQDPLCEKSRKGSTYGYVSNNPLKYVDPDGMDEVEINGPKAKEATQKLQASTSLTLSRDENTGKISATGKAKTDADKKLLEAINDKTVVVRLNATGSNYDADGLPITGGAFNGSELDPTGDGITYAYQTVNPDQTQIIDQFYKVQSGVTVLHEVLESFIAATNSPGALVPTTESDPKSAEYLDFMSAHKNAMKVDPRYIEPDIVRDPATAQLSLRKISMGPQFKVKEELKLINDLKK